MTKMITTMLLFKSLAVSEQSAIDLGARLALIASSIYDILFPARLDLAVKAAEYFLPDRLKHLAHQDHFRENYLCFMQHLPEGYRALVLWSIKKACAHPERLGNTSNLSWAYELLPARAVVGFALANQQYTPGEMFGHMSMREMDPGYFDTEDLSRFSNFSALPDFNIEKLLDRAPDLIVIGSGFGAGAVTARGCRYKTRVDSHAVVV